MSALDTALDLISRGWSPLPLPFKTKRPTIDGWPDLRISAETAPRYFNGKPQNVGVILGAASSGLTDIDLDCPEAVAVAPWFLPETGALFGRASRRSSHWLFVSNLAETAGVKAVEFHDPTLGRNAAGAMLCEIRIGGGGKGAQTVVPGSTHETGEEVAWEKSGSPAQVDAADLRQRVERLAAAALLARYWADGKRHGGALVLGGMLARSGWGISAIKLFVEAVARAAGDTDVADRKKAAEDAASTAQAGGRACGFPKLKELFGEPVAKAVANWLHYEPVKIMRDRKSSGSASFDANADPAGPGDNVGLVTEDEGAILFAERHRGELRYCHDHGAWFEWTGSIWKRNGTSKAFHFARELARQMAESQDRKTEITARKAAFAGAVERFARADPAFAVTAEIWDRDPWLLGTPGGTVDLRTGELRPAKQEDGITRSTAVVPAPAADCPLWLKFLDETFGNDAALIAFAQRWAGYSLTGLTREHALVFGYGSGGNGKSVYVNVHVGIAGDYATTASMDVFIASHGDRHPTDLAMLRGARVVTASETEEGRQWAESRIKQLTGGDLISARFMRQDFFTFLPTFKLLIIGNHKPGLRNVDEAARRRFNLVPFTRKPAVPDRQLEEKLKAEWPAILRWMIDGCLAWQRDGLAPPESVREATDAYFEDQDILSEWLAEKCIVEPANANRKETTADLFASWSAYAKAANEPTGTVRSFAQTLEKHGLQPVKSVPTFGGRRVRGFAGITVLHDQQRQAAE